MPWACTGCGSTAPASSAAAPTARGSGPAGCCANSPPRRAAKQESDMAQLPVTYWSREAMLKRVARFDRLQGSDGGLPDSRYPASIRTLHNVIGFQPPEGEGEVHSPLGAQP